MAETASIIAIGVWLASGSPRAGDVAKLSPIVDWRIGSERCGLFVERRAGGFRATRRKISFDIRYERGDRNERFAYLLEPRLDQPVKGLAVALPREVERLHIQ